MSTATDTRRNPGWFDENSCRIDDFAAIVEQATDPADYPHAAGVRQNVLVYAAADLGSGADRREVQAELARALMDGPGIVVLAGAFPDTDVVDRASAVFVVLGILSWVIRLPNPSMAFWKWCAPLGGISYALYVLHQPAIYFVEHTVVPSGKWHFAAGLVLAMSVVLIAAFVLERVMQPWLNKLLRGRKVFPPPLHPYPPVH